MAELRIPEPSEKQCLFMADRHKYIGYGGARGGGKSWAVRVKAELMQRLAYNGTMQRELAMYQQYALALTQKYEPDKAGALMESITGRAGGGKRAKRAAKLKGKESGRMERARSNAYNAALPGGGR